MILQPYDVEVGAGTFHPATVLRALGPKPWNAAYVQPSRRPADGRYGENPNRLQHYYQFQVILKPRPPTRRSSTSSSLQRDRHRPAAARHPLRRGRLGEPDARRLGPRLGGLVRRHGGHAVHLLPAGRRHRVRPGRGRAHLRARAAGDVRAGRRNVYDLEFNDAGSAAKPTATSSCDEREYSAYNFERADTATLFAPVRGRRAECARCSTGRRQRWLLPAYDQCMKASHLFNLLDARGAIAVAERAELHRPHPRPRQRRAARPGLRAEQRRRMRLSHAPAPARAVLARRSPRACRRRRREDLERLAREQLAADGLLPERRDLRGAAPPGAGRRGPADRAGRPDARSARARASARPSRRSRASCARRRPARSTSCVKRDARALLVRRRSSKTGRPTRRGRWPRWSTPSCAASRGRSRCAGASGDAALGAAAAAHPLRVRRRDRAVELDVIGAKSGGDTDGPPLPGAGSPSACTTSTTYRTKLRAALRRPRPRRAARRSSATMRALARRARTGLRLKDDGLLDEVAGLVEWPVVLVGTIDEPSWTCRPR